MIGISAIPQVDFYLSRSIYFATILTRTLPPATPSPSRPWCRVIITGESKNLTPHIWGGRDPKYAPDYFFHIPFRIIKEGTLCRSIEYGSIGTPYLCKKYDGKTHNRI